MGVPAAVKVPKPEILAGSGVPPVLHENTALGRQQRGKNPGKTKKSRSSTLLGAFPAWGTPAL